MLSLGDFLDWQTSYNSDEEFPSQDWNFDGRVDGQDLTALLDTNESWPTTDTSIDGATAPTGLLRVTDKMQFLMDDSSIVSAMMNYNGRRVVQVPQQHALWLGVLNQDIPVKGFIRFYMRDSGNLGVQADLTQLDDGNELVSYRRNILITPNGDVSNVSGQVSLRSQTDIYNAEIIDDGWMLVRQHHTENTDIVDADWFAWYHRGQEFQRRGHNETTAVTSLDTGGILTATTDVQKDIWTGPTEPTSHERDATTIVRIADSTMMIKEETIDADTTTTYDEEIHEGLWLTIARDEGITTDTETKNYDFGVLVSTQNDHETEQWNYGVLMETTSLTTVDGFSDTVDNSYSFLTYYDSLNSVDFSRSFSFDAEHRLTSFHVEYNDEKLVFLPFVAYYRVTGTTFDINDAIELNAAVRYLEEIENEFSLGEVAYPEIDTSLPTMGG